MASDIYGLLGLLGGAYGANVLGNKKVERAKKEKEDDRLADYEFRKLMRDEEREYQKQLKEEEKAARIAEDESKFTIGDIFDPGNIFSQGISYDDMSPAEIALTAGSFLIPGGLAARAGLSGLKALGGMSGLGSSMMSGLGGRYGAAAGAGATGATMLPRMNQGGRAGFELGGMGYDGTEMGYNDVLERFAEGLSEQEFIEFQAMSPDEQMSLMQSLGLMR
tara:strand:+ start:1215 stop:1877 length:663 start_codon:yes stop_codon:yes gene_type:complete